MQVSNCTISKCQMYVKSFVCILITYTIYYHITVHVYYYWRIARDDCAGFSYSFYYLFYSRLHFSLPKQSYINNKLFSFTYSRAQIHYL